MNDTLQYPVGSNEKSGRSHLMQVRVRLLQSALLVVFGIVTLRLIQVQIVQSAKYRQMAQKQYQSRIDLPAARGVLYDRSRNILATNSMFVSFAADPKLAAEDARAIAESFARVFNKPKSWYLDKLHSDSRFVWLERQVDQITAAKLDLRKLDGIVVRNEPKRLYYCGQVGGQLIGCTNIDNGGIAGLELQLDQVLRGVDGYVVFQRDGLGKARPSVDYPRVEPVNGNNVLLTIDIGLQAIAEKELKRGVEENHAERGIVVILQPKTGEVLALAQYPSIDPNLYGKYQPTDQRLRAVTDIFEPGSVFKIVTASAALEYNLVKPDRKFFAENGTYSVPIGNGKSRVITDAHKEGWITFQQAIEVSSNIVMAKISDIIGSERLYKTARDFGFGIPTNVEFPGEASGVLKKPMEWSGTTLNTIAYGYEVSVTPMQIAAAYGAIANKGLLMKPHLYTKIFNERGEVIQSVDPQPIRRIVSESTAKTLTDFFEGVVQRGTGKPAKIEGIRIAGKTGTSKKLVNGEYQGIYTASFVGFLPVEDPRLVCLVMMDNPQGVSYYGGTTSAPVFRSIIERIISSSDFFSPSPQSGNVMAADSVSTPAQSPTRQVTRVADNTVVCQDSAMIPDVRGYSIRQAMNVLAGIKFHPVVNGSGVVIHQSPEAGQKAKPGTRIILTCQPKTTAALSVN